MRLMSVGLLVAALGITACHTLTPVTWTEIEGLRPSRIYVTRDDQSVVQLTGVRVFGDTVVGYESGSFVELPIASVQRVSVRKLNRAKTVGLLLAGTAAATAIAVWMSGAGEPDPEADIDCMEFPEEPECIF